VSPEHKIIFNCIHPTLKLLRVSVLYLCVAWAFYL